MPVQNVAVDRRKPRSWTSELSLNIGAPFRSWRMPTALGLAGLVLALTWLAIGVHVHGCVTALDAPTASWIGNAAHRSHRLDVATLMTERFANNATVAVSSSGGIAVRAGGTTNFLIDVFGFYF